MSTIGYDTRKLIFLAFLSSLVQQSSTCAFPLVVKVTVASL